ncbi:hypothetical protein Tco_0441655 [Tanacetum coccineum]
MLDRSFLLGRRNSVSVLLVGINNADRLMVQTTSSYFQNYSRHVYYDQMYMGEGRWGTAIKSSAVVFGGYWRGQLVQVRKWLGSPYVSNGVVYCSQLFKRLDQNGSAFLEADFTMDEVKVAVWDCSSLQSPGPHGLNLKFIKGEGSNISLLQYVDDALFFSVTGPFGMLVTWEYISKQVESNARYSAFKIKELKQDKPADPKALLFVDSMDEVAGEFALMGVTSQVQTCPFGCHHKYAELKKEFDDLEVQYKEYYIQVQAYKNTLKTLEQQKAWYQSNQLTYEEKVKTKLDNTLARFAKWKESSKNLAKLVDSSMTVKTKLGMGYGDYIGEDEIYYLTMPSIFDTTPKDVDVTSPHNPRSMTLPHVIQVTSHLHATHGRSGNVTFPAGSVNMPAPIPAGRQTGPALVYAGIPVPAVSAGWRNNAARPMSRPISSYFQNYSRPVYYDQMYMGEGRWGTAVKSSAGCSWRDSRPYLQRGSKNNGGSQQSTWKILLLVRSAVSALPKLVTIDLENSSAFLEADFTMDEVKAAVWDCSSLQSPGPHGLNLKFIKGIGISSS